VLSTSRLALAVELAQVSAAVLLATTVELTTTSLLLVEAFSVGGVGGVGVLLPQAWSRYTAKIAAMGLILNVVVGYLINKGVPPTKSSDRSSALGLKIFSDLFVQTKNQILC